MRYDQFDNDPDNEDYTSWGADMCPLCGARRVHIREHYEDCERCNWSQMTSPDAVAGTPVPAKPCKECERYKEMGFGPSHNGSVLCRSGSLKSGGTTAHCTCNSCF